MTMPNPTWQEVAECLAQNLADHMHDDPKAVLRAVQDTGEPPPGTVRPEAYKGNGDPEDVRILWLAHGDALFDGGLLVIAEDGKRLALSPAGEMVMAAIEDSPLRSEPDAL